uniref:Uncharacterized protein n=1 Tax=Grammatophora oceanica TaxID=210454 RepID=A0A7S1V7K3_9STRA
MGREFYARNSFLSLLTDIGGDRGVDGGLDLSAKIKDNAVSIVFYSLMKKIWMPDFVARPFGKLMSMCLADSIEPPPPKDLIEACRDFESRVTKDGKLELQSGLFERSSKIYRRLPYEVGNDSFKI